CGAGGRSGLHPGTLSGRRPGHQERQQNRPACGGGRAAPAAGEGDLGAAVSELLELTPHRQGPPHTAEALFARSYRSSSFFRYRPVKLDRQAATSSGVPVQTMVPPPSPPSGPRSIRWSAHLITSRLCSM
ncbi:Cysteine-rich VLP domain-containing protein, partial [Dysosmobacter welbionis]